MHCHGRREICPIQIEAEIFLHPIRPASGRGREREPKTKMTLIVCFLFLSLSLPQYEPVIESRSNLPFMKHIILYECQGSTPELEIMSREFGRSCMKAEKELLTCNSIVAAWSRGSEVSFP